MPNNDKQRDQGSQSQKREGQGPGQQGGFNNPSRGAGGTQQQEHQQKDRGQKQNPGTTQSGGRSGMGHDDDEM